MHGLNVLMVDALISNRYKTLQDSCKETCDHVCVSLNITYRHTSCSAVQ